MSVKRNNPTYILTFESESEKEEKKMKVVGIQKNLCFNMDGREVRGMNLFVAEKRDKVEGSATDKIFISETKEVFAVALSLKVGDSFTPIYNKWGKVDDILIDSDK